MFCIPTIVKAEFIFLSLKNTHKGSLRLAEFRATRGPSASPYPAGIGHDESCTSTNTTRFGGRRGMLLAVNSTPLPQICAGSSTEGTRSSLATRKGGHQKKTVRISSQHAPAFSRSPSLEVMRSHHGGIRSKLLDDDDQHFSIVQIQSESIERNGIGMVTFCSTS